MKCYLAASCCWKARCRIHIPVWSQHLDSILLQLPTDMFLPEPPIHKKWSRMSTPQLFAWPLMELAIHGFAACSCLSPGFTRSRECGHPNFTLVTLSCWWRSKQTWLSQSCYNVMLCLLCLLCLHQRSQVTLLLLAARNVYHASHGSRTRMARSRTAVTAARTDLEYFGMVFWLWMGSPWTSVRSLLFELFAGQRAPTQDDLRFHLSPLAVPNYTNWNTHDKRRIIACEGFGVLSINTLQASWLSLAFSMNRDPFVFVKRLTVKAHIWHQHDIIWRQLILSNINI